MTKEFLNSFILCFFSGMPMFSLAQVLQENLKDTINHSKRLEAIVITSVRANEHMPIAQSTLQQQQIKSNYAGQEIPIVLANTPSVTWYSDGGHFTGYSYMRLRGIDQTRINFTLNGVPLNEPEDQGAYFSNYPDFLNNVQSVQIQRGVGTSTNGTCSFAGSVNFESPSLLDSTGVEMQVSTGSYNTWQISPQFKSGLIKNKMAFYARYSNTRSDGFREHSGTKGQTAFISAGYFGRKSVIKFTAFTGMSKNEMAYLAVSKTDLKSNYRMNYLGENERDRFHQSLAMLQYSLSISRNSYLLATVYYNHLNGNYDIYFAPDILNYAVRSNFLGSILNYQYEKEKITISAGLHVNQYQRHHFLRVKPNLNENLYFNTGQKRELSSFVKLIYTNNRFSWFADAQMRSVQFDFLPDAAVQLPFNKVAWNFFNPKIGLSFQASHRKQFYFSIGKTSREPTRNDMFAGYDNIDDTNYGEVGDFKKVKPEVVVDLELGMKLNFSKFIFNANLYSMQFKNEIAAIGQLSAIGLPLRKNVASSFRNGVELSAEIKPIDGMRIITQANFSHNRIKKYTSDFDNVTYKNVTPLLTPNSIVNQSIRHCFNPRIEVELGVRYMSKSYLSNANDATLIAPASAITNASFHFRILKNHSLTLMANNIFNQHYYTSGYVQSNEAFFFAMATRNFYATLNLKF
jgi:iron complex outermembrane recepter protein